MDLSMPRSTLMKPPAQSGILTIKSTAALVAGITILSASIAAGGFIYTQSRHDTYVELRRETREVRVIQQAMSDAHIAVHGLVSRSISSVDHYHTGRRILAEHAARIAAIDRYLKSVGSAPRMREGIDRLLIDWQAAMNLVAAHEHQKAADDLMSRGTDGLYSETRDGLERYWVDRTKVARDTIQDDELLKWLVLLFQVAAGACSLGGLWVILKMTTAEDKERTAARRATEVSHASMQQLFQMTDMLQSAAGFTDANAVLNATAGELLSEFGGALYVLNETHDRLSRSTIFGAAEPGDFPDFIVPSECWSLKRGKSHINLAEPGALCCEHHHSLHPVLEVPMMARGELVGTLHVVAKGENAIAALRSSESMIFAIADSMSLSLSNIVLREKLRGEILRDPLTRLYNRRYLDDTMQRFILLAQREKKSLSILAVRIDNFRQFAAKHSSVICNALLRETATIIFSGLRRSDFAARYDDEHIVVLLPECALDNAVAIAATLRQKIMGLSTEFSDPVSASFGVAAFPDTSDNMADMFASATAAAAAAITKGTGVETAASVARPVRSAAPTMIAAE
jgi:diguanylate cyclase (GGDEF)-like protein